MKRGYSLPLIIIFAFIGIIALPSLLKDEENENTMNMNMNLESVDFSFENEAMYKNWVFLCDNGAISISGSVLTYTSFEERASIVLCNTLDCTHDNIDCPAWHGEENVYAIYYYKGKQYIVSSNQNGMFNKVNLYEAEVDGTNRQIVQKFDYYDGCDYFCVENMIYMFLQEEMDTLHVSANGSMHETPQTTRLVAYNIDTGEISDVVIHERNYRQYCEFLGIYDGKVYYSYQYSTKPREEMYDENDLKMEEVYENSFRMGIACIDVEGNQSVEIMCEAASVSIVGLSNGKLYWYIDEGKKIPEEVIVYDINTKTTNIIQIDAEMPNSAVRVVDDKLFFNYWDEEGFEVYDIESGKITKYDQLGYVIGEYNDYYLLGINPMSSGASCAMRKDDLGNEDKFIVLQ